MKLQHLLGAALLSLSLSFPVLAEPLPEPQSEPDQVERLATLVALSDDQKARIREILADLQAQIRDLRVEALTLQQKLQDHIRPDYDEAAIRADAEKLGDLSGEISALSTLLQAKVDSVFTQEQRDELDRRMREMQPTAPTR
ncbi:Spy/CpxP family protein refolding chaperone [Marinobacter mobilis]|uniref:Periplasmic heavy metal sensor n=1 Tax=Marinobacter mobilis TaxID=488533 RepID=A0A1H3D1S3_9GAMM|nr:Spy/CpxP family protein refolding chaperone [Marinobacter mobilis]SDX60286.1 hypothetical protein SAMN04487960_111106 [Marinobacter mobilis]